MPFSICRRTVLRSWPRSTTQRSTRAPAPRSRRSCTTRRSSRPRSHRPSPGSLNRRRKRWRSSRARRSTTPCSRSRSRRRSRGCSVELSPTVLGSLGDAWLNPERSAVTRFNSIVSPHRVFETRRFTIEEFKRIRGLVKGATVNDAVLAVCGGALRRYLQKHEELPAPTLVSIAPVSRRNRRGIQTAPRAAPHRHR